MPKLKEARSSFSQDIAEEVSIAEPLAEYHDPHISSINDIQDIKKENILHVNHTISDTIDTSDIQIDLPRETEQRKKPGPKPRKTGMNEMLHIKVDELTLVAIKKLQWVGEGKPRSQIVIEALKYYIQSLPENVKKTPEIERFLSKDYRYL